MCYYNSVKVNQSELLRLKSIEKAMAGYDFLNKPLLNGFDYHPVPVLKRVDQKHDFELVQMEWGFMPSYIKTREQTDKFRMGYKKENGQWQEPILTLNAKSEELLGERKMYREAALNRRCLVLSTGFFEWRHQFPVSKKTGKPLKTAVKYPYRIGVKNRNYFFMAGIYNPWKDESTGEYVETCSIITTAANPLMEQIHNTKKRMPTILTDDLAWDWLFGDLDEAKVLEIAGSQFPANELEAYPVAKDFRQALDPAEAFSYPDLPELETKF